MSYVVIRDTREKPDHGWFWDASSTCGGTTVAKLNEGDYSIDGYQHLVAIERKGSVSELAANVTQDRFYRELERLRAIKYVWLLLEFDVEDLYQYPVGSDVPKYKWKKIRIRGPYIMKCLTEIQINYPNINVVFCGSHGKEIASNIFKRIVEKVKDARASSDES